MLCKKSEMCTGLLSYYVCVCDVGVVLKGTLKRLANIKNIDNLTEQSDMDNIRAVLALRLQETPP